MMLLGKYGIKQIGYYVENLEETAQLLFDSMGAGPFVDMGINPPQSCVVRGEEQPVRTRCALGNLGDMQLELIEVHSDCPDPYKEMGRFGIHHFCIWVDDVDAVVAEFEAHGMPLAMKLVSGAGMTVAYIDARQQLGQYIEVNPPLEQLAAGVAALHKSGASPDALISMQDFMGMMKR